jgi:thiol-disulfide isomerase/thioredoxin
MRNAALPVIAALSIVACGGDRPVAHTARVEGVKSPAAPLAPNRWLDVSYQTGTAPVFSFPRVVAARTAAPVPAFTRGRWAWINLWATWCGPCRGEMPLLVTWQEQLRRDGVPIDLWFVSIDDRQEDLDRFLRDNPSVAPGNSVRLAVRRDLERWLAAFPGARSDTVPLQIIVAPDGTVRGIREGSLREGDYPTVKALFTR